MKTQKAQVENRRFFRAIRPAIRTEPPDAPPRIDWTAVEGLIARHDADYPTLSPPKQDNPSTSISPHRLSRAPSTQPTPSIHKPAMDIPTSGVADGNESHEGPPPQSSAEPPTLTVTTLAQPSSDSSVPAVVPPTIVPTILPTTPDEQQASFSAGVSGEERTKVSNISSGESLSEETRAVGSPLGAPIETSKPHIVADPGAQITASRGPEPEPAGFPEQPQARPGQQQNGSDEEIHPITAPPSKIDTSGTPEAVENKSPGDLLPGGHVPRLTSAPVHDEIAVSQPASSAGIAALSVPPEAAVPQDGGLSSHRAAVVDGKRKERDEPGGVEFEPAKKKLNKGGQEDTEEGSKPSKPGKPKGPKRRKGGKTDPNEPIEPLVVNGQTPPADPSVPWRLIHTFRQKIRPYLAYGTQGKDRCNRCQTKRILVCWTIPGLSCEICKLAKAKCGKPLYTPKLESDESPIEQMHVDGGPTDGQVSTSGRILDTVPLEVEDDAMAVSSRGTFEIVSPGSLDEPTVATEVPEVASLSTAPRLVVSRSSSTAPGFISSWSPSTAPGFFASRSPSMAPGFVASRSPSTAPRFLGTNILDEDVETRVARLEGIVFQLAGGVKDRDKRITALLQEQRSLKKESNERITALLQEQQSLKAFISQRMGGGSPPS